LGENDRLKVDLLEELHQPILVVLTSYIGQCRDQYRFTQRPI